MVTNELRSYIAAQLHKGVSKTQLRATLLAAGWTTTDIDSAFSDVPVPPPTPEPTPEPKKEPEQKTYIAKPARSHRVAGVIIAISGCILLGLLLFYFIKTAQNTPATATTVTKRINYTSSEHGFSFLYPEGWKLESDPTGATVTSSSTQESELYKQYKYGDAMIASDDYNDAAGLSHEAQAKAHALSYASDKTSMEVRYAGLNGYAVVTAEPTITALSIVLAGENAIYSLQFPGATSIGTLTIEQKAILSSFKPVSK